MAQPGDCYNAYDFDAQARWRLPRPLYDYVAGGADDERTLAENSAAFDRCALVPNVLRDVRQVDMARRVLGSDLAWPVLLAPTGMSRMFHSDGERGVARAAGESGVAYCLSTMGSESIETIAASGRGPKMYQLYLLTDDALNFAAIDRAKAAGYAGLILTVDTLVAGNRERDLRSGLTVPPRLGLGSLMHFAARPRWVLDYLRAGRFTMPNVAASGAADADLSTLGAFFAARMERYVSWDRVARIADHWGGPFAIKGIQAPDDAARAIAAGASAVIVSNHGGRQLDGVAATFDLLGDVVDAVAGRGEVILDGGVRRGTHIVKALAMGARAVMLGRPYVYALASFGEPGVARLLSLLHAEMARTLALLGCASLDELSRAHLRRADTALARPPYMIRP
jgi:L-lactate dehydrogenase (cytochrome)